MSNPTAPLRPFEAELLPMLAQVAEEDLAYRGAVVTAPFRRSRRIALVAAMAAAVALALPLASDDPLRGALAIERHGDTLYLSVEDATADPEAMTNDLRAQGLKAQVEVVPVSASLEGAWLDIVNDDLGSGGDPRIVEVQEQMSDQHPKILAFPADFSAAFILSVGRPAEAGETFQVALTKDVQRAYHCLGLAGMSPDAAAEAIAAKGYEAVWYYNDPDGPTRVLDGPPSDKVITGAEFVGPTTVMVTTAEAGTPPHDYRGAGTKGASGSC